MDEKHFKSIQKTQFEKISKNYEIHDRVSSALYEKARAFYYPRLKGKKVLDVGNGGQPPAMLLGKEAAAQIELFVGIDNSYEMLCRGDHTYVKVAADGFKLPFVDGAFDYVVVNGVLHHLGYLSPKREENEARIIQFLTELRRVCCEEVLIYEPMLPSWLESLERIGSRVLNGMPTFVWSRASLNKITTQMGLDMRQIRSFSLRQLTHPFYWYLVMMDYPWLKIPAIISPFQHVFFTLRGGADKAVTEQAIFACPKCKAPLPGLIQDELAPLNCDACMIQYQRKNGIPIFI